MRFNTLIPLLLVLGFAGCRTADRSAASARLFDAGAPEHLYAVNRSFADGEILELPVDPTRPMKRIVLKYRSDAKEQPFAQAYVLGADGVEREITAKRPLDPNGTTDWQDLVQRQGGMLVLRFTMPLVRQLPLESVLVRYE